MTLSSLPQQLATMENEQRAAALPQIRLKYPLEKVSSDLRAVNLMI